MNLCCFNFTVFGTNSFLFIRTFSVIDNITIGFSYDTKMIQVIKTLSIILYFSILSFAFGNEELSLRKYYTYSKILNRNTRLKP